MDGSPRGSGSFWRRPRSSRLTMVAGLPRGLREQGVDPMDPERTTLVLVGGFLGAGKTPLLRRAGRSLGASGKRVGLITNDQAPDLADTGLLRSDGLRVEEVAGGCFCCRFPDLISAAEGLVEGGRLRGGERVDVILGEPGGGCTDLSATVLQPLKARRRGAVG